MSLRFILGVAGAGKTTRCLAEIQRRLREAPLGPCLLLLVPEQASFQAETALLGAAGIEGTFRAQVLSFHRLAWRVLQEAGGAGRIHLSEVGRHMVLRAAVEKRLDDLRVFRPAAQRPNFAAAVADMLQEMQAYGVTPEDLEVRAAELGKAEGRELLGAKLGELSLLWREYASLLEGRCLAPTDYLHLLARRIPHARFLAGGEVWVDGFNGFTPQEYDVLQVLLQVSRRLTVALCLDPDLEGRQPDPDALFARTHATYWRLVELAEGAGVPVEKSMVLGKSTPPRFAASPPLQHLERALRQYPRPSYQGEVREVRLVAAPSCRAEVEAAAREMIRLARDEGYRWRDMAVLVREMEPYQRLLELVLEEYDIPCFIDCKRPVTDHPLVVLLCAALEVVSSGWAYEAVMRYLKTDLVPVGREEVDALENYLLAHGIRGSRWYDEHPWTYRLGERAGRAVPSRGEEGFIADLNRLRQQIAAPLRRLQEALQADPSVRGACAALVRLMEELGVEDTLRAWVESAVAEGSLEEAQQHAQVHAQVLEVLDEMVQALGEQSPGAERFLQTLEAGFHALRLGVVPPGLDQVFAGSLDRSRNPEVKACFVLGANEGVFPARAAGGGVLSEGEREELAAAGMSLGPGERQQLFDEQYLVYVALTRSSHRLWVSYALTADESVSLAPSVVVDDLQAVFPTLPVDRLPADLDVRQDPLPLLVHPRRALSMLAPVLRQRGQGTPVHPNWLHARDWLELTFPVAYRRSTAGVSYRPVTPPLSPAARRVLYGTRMCLSVTQIEQFLACPFAHFVRFGLRAEERQVATLRPLDLGHFFHRGLERFVHLVVASGADWSELAPDVIQGMIGTIVGELMPQLQGERYLTSRRQQYLAGKLRDILVQSARAVATQLAAGEFRPVAVEACFGPGEGLPPLVFPLQGGATVELAGRVDRVDAAPAGEAMLLRVVDYKSGAVSLDLGEVYHGLRLQLPTYLQAVLAVESDRTPRLPAGMFYFTVGRPLLRARAAPGDDEAARLAARAFRLRGLVVNEPGVIAKMDRQLVNGESSVIPVALRDTGEVHGRSGVISLGQFELLRRHLARTVASAGEAMRRGEVSAAPYWRKGTTPCGSCGLQAICRFDPAAGHRYRVLRDPSRPRLWEAMETGEEHD